MASILRAASALSKCTHVDLRMAARAAGLSVGNSLPANLAGSHLFTAIIAALRF